MWIIGAVVCIGLMLAGHGLAGRHGQPPQAHHGVAVQQPAPPAGAPYAPAAEVQAASAPRPEAGQPHH